MTITDQQKIEISNNAKEFVSILIASVGVEKTIDFFKEINTFPQKDPKMFAKIVDPQTWEKLKGLKEPKGKGLGALIKTAKEIMTIFEL